MGMSRELIDTRENGVQVWVCSNCGWSRPYPRLVPRVGDSRDGLLKEFIHHVCADYPSENQRDRRIEYLRGRIEVLKARKQALWSRSSTPESDMETRKEWTENLDAVIERLRRFTAELAELERDAARK